ncbi:hypothetical protein BV898_13348 [Hypsibius exemplaris]|uniref:Uncharacterized protein n=1 Tax=Hypsibius exemplaris TaxID=2072580 RepID=A0A1W0WB00_HYPEX|nr:hypothetical protein BV898_13348 [Hypsibius exemplaris]
MPEFLAQQLAAALVQHHRDRLRRRSGRVGSGARVFRFLFIAVLFVNFLGLFLVRSTLPIPERIDSRLFNEGLHEKGPRTGGLLLRLSFQPFSG